MADWRVEWSARAQTDFLDILRFIAQDSPANARRIARRIDDAAQSLRQLPLRGRVLPELSEGLPMTLHELAVPPWRLLYSVTGRIVKITGVVDGRRDMLAWLNREQSRFGAGEA